VRAVVIRKIPATIPVASTDLVSRNTQKVTANQVVKLMTDTSNVLTSSWMKVRSVLLFRSRVRIELDMFWSPWVYLPPKSTSHSLETHRLRYIPYTRSLVPRVAITHPIPPGLDGSKGK